MLFDGCVVAGHLQFEQHAPAVPFELRRNRRTEAHDPRPAVRTPAPERGDLDRFAHDARIDALEQRAHLRLRVARAQHRVDRFARKRQTMNARVETSEPHQDHAEEQHRREQGGPDRAAVVQHDADDDVRPGGFGKGGEHRAAVREVAAPRAHERAALADGLQRIDPHEIREQHEAGSDADEDTHPGE